MCGWLQRNPATQFGFWHHSMPSTAGCTNRKHRSEWSLPSYHHLHVLTWVRCTKPSSWGFYHWIFSQVIQLSHEGSLDPKVATSCKSTLVLLQKMWGRFFQRAVKCPHRFNQSWATNHKLHLWKTWHLLQLLTPTSYKLLQLLISRTCNLWLQVKNTFSTSSLLALKL